MVLESLVSYITVESGPLTMFPVSALLENTARPLTLFPVTSLLVNAARLRGVQHVRGVLHLVQDKDSGAHLLSSSGRAFKSGASSSDTSSKLVDLGDFAIAVPDGELEADEECRKDLVELRVHHQTEENQKDGDHTVENIIKCGKGPSSPNLHMPHITPICPNSSKTSSLAARTDPSLASARAAHSGGLGDCRRPHPVGPLQPPHPRGSRQDTDYGFRPRPPPAAVDVLRPQDSPPVDDPVPHSFDDSLASYQFEAFIR